MKTRRWISLALLGMLALYLAVPARAAGTPWWAEAQEYVVSRGLMTGTQNGFEPTRWADRSSVFQTLYNLEGRPQVAGGSDFTDVAGKWFEGTAAWAQAAGLATGDEDHAFRGERPITRSELVTVFYRYARYRGVDVSIGDDGGFWQHPDAGQVQGWAVTPLRWACGMGLLGGDDRGMLAPEESANRAHLATLLMRYDRMLNQLPLTVTGTVIQVEPLGHILTDILVQDFHFAGFLLGDVITVEAGSFRGDMPFFDGYYVDDGEYMIRAYPAQLNVAVCLMGDSFAQLAGVGVGDQVTFTLKERGGALDIQEAGFPGKRARDAAKAAGTP